MKKVIPLVLGSVLVSLATVVNAQTIEPLRGGISCNTWEWQYYQKVEPGRCGLGEGGLSQYRVWTGRNCSQRDSSNRIVKTFPIYHTPGTQQWVGCK
jgi:hypothetical protein